MNKTKPLVTVVLPAFNASATIADTILSILGQSYDNWELLVINDGSVDHTIDVINSFDDNRIRLINNESNKGLIYSLNRGIEYAQGKYIARIDADDIAKPNRFEHQVAFMEMHQDIIVCGSFMETFGDVSKPYTICFETTSDSIKTNFPLKPAFGHPSVFIRKSVLDETGIRYDINYKCAEDTKLWLDLMPFGEYANIPEVLMNYRISETQCTQSGNLMMIENARKCRIKYIDALTRGWYSKQVGERSISITLLREFKKKYDNKNLLIGLYRSMRPYQLSVLLYLIISLDIMNFPAKEVKNIIRRFLNRTYPIF